MHLYLDTETFSTADLKKTGVYAYTEAPGFEVLMCAYSIDGGDVQVAVGHDEIIDQIGEMLDDPYVVKVAHNAQFDRVVLSAMLGMPVGHYLDPAQWDDSVMLAAIAGLPLSLEHLAKELKVTPKDSAGTRLINLFSKPNRKGERTMPGDQPDAWLAFIDYCAQDVETLVELWPKLPSWPTADERRTYIADQRINDRGIQADLELAAWAVEQDERNRTAASAELEELLGIDNAGSTQQLIEGLSRIGLDVENLRAETVQGHLDGDELTDDQRKALKLRQETALAASRKYQAVLSMTSADRRFRGGFRFYGGHTGRWSGRGIQLQNLPRAQVDNVNAALLDARLGLDADSQTLKGLIRSTLVGPFAVSDYSAIEARVVGWLAGEKWLIEAFEEGRDIYVAQAERMGGLTRQQGKVATLALGYQGGVHALRVMGAEGTDDELTKLKVQWRRANRKIVAFWSDIEDAFEHGGSVGLITVRKVGRDRHVYLPSGRFLAYRNVKRETWYTTDDEGNRVRQHSLRFTGSRGRSATYGGKLVENIVQAVARDVLAALLIELMDAGIPVVGHVHDEVIVEDDGQPGLLDRVVEMMSTGPEWSSGLPLNAEGFRCERYKKG